MNKLVHQSLRHIRFADDALLVVLTYGAAQLVVVHRRPILSEPPQSGNMSRVFDFKNTWWNDKNDNEGTSVTHQRSVGMLVIEEDGVAG